MTAGVAARLAAAKNSIRDALDQAGRDDEVTLVAVSKTVPADPLVEAYDAGQRDFGENRVQEALDKQKTLAGRVTEVRWHLIGHLQRNKAKAAVGAFSLIESVDSTRLAREIDARAEALQISVPVLFEINIAGEASKGGFSRDEFLAELPALLSLPRLSACGLMTVAPLASDPSDVRPVFARLRELRDEIRERYALVEFVHLSMGMSNDYREAISEGATIVRLGRAIFGERPASQ